MKKIALAMGLMTQLNGMELDGWFYAGATGKQIHFKDHESFITNSFDTQDDYPHVKIHSIGVVAGVGVVFPSPFFLNLEGDYTELQHSPIHQESRILGMSRFISDTLKGHFYTLSVKGGYLFQPFCDVPWSLYPLFSYDADSLSVHFATFPFSIPLQAQVNDFAFDFDLTLRGPAIGLGTAFNLPFGFVVTTEGSWQFRRFKNEGHNAVVLEVLHVTEMRQKQHAETTAWVQGPRINLSVDYYYCNWFVGVTGEWQRLRQFSNGEGFQNNKSRNLNTETGTLLHFNFFESPLQVKSVTWESWIWKAYIGYIF